MIVASNGYPEVGVITDYEINCTMGCLPVSNLVGTYQWNGNDEFGTLLTWDWEGQTNEFQTYMILKMANCCPSVIAEIEDPSERSYFDATDEIGATEYIVLVTYERLNEYCESDPSTVTVDVTSVSENSNRPMLYPNPASDRFTIEGKAKEIKVFDALGQLVYQGVANTVEVAAWPQGAYFVRIVDEDDAVSVVKFMKR